MQMRITIELNPLDATVLSELRDIRAQEAKQLMVNAETRAALARIDTATSALGERVTALAAKVGTGMTDAEVAEFNTGILDVANRLDGMAKDPENPV